LSIHVGAIGKIAVCVDIEHVMSFLFADYHSPLMHSKRRSSVAIEEGGDGER
jgi:hypothetical protein